jgi:hypothetical protein
MSGAFESKSSDMAPSVSTEIDTFPALSKCFCFLSLFPLLSKSCTLLLSLLREMKKGMCYPIVRIKYNRMGDS